MGRPAGSPNKPKPPKPEGAGRGRLREAVSQAFSTDRLVAILKKLSPVEAARVISSLEPREKAEPPGVFNLIIEGLPPVCPKCGYRSEKTKEGIANV